MLINRPHARTDSKPRAARYKMDRELIVASRTIGTSVSYPLRTDNVSKSGLLLTWKADSKVPFIENTILEMTIDPNSVWLEVPVHCLGKVVRKLQRSKDSASTTEVQFGIRIVQIDHDDLTIWDTCIDDLSRRVGELISAENPEMLHEPKAKRFG